MLVANGYVVQVADQDLSLLTITPTVVLINDIPLKVDDSWYRGQPYVFLKITAIEPSNALRNAAELQDVLVTTYGSKESIPPFLILHIDGGARKPENISVSENCCNHAISIIEFGHGNRFENSTWSFV